MIDRMKNHPSYKKGALLAKRGYDRVIQQTMEYIDKHKVRERMRNFWELLKDVLTRKVTLPVWALIAIISTCSYILSPVDLLPDLLPLGFIDDIVLAIYTYESIVKKQMRINEEESTQQQEKQNVDYS